MNLRFSLLVGLMACVPAMGAQPDRPISLHPDNPHYFLFRGKPAVLITSGEHYGAVLNLDFDHGPYLDELKSHGFNLTRTFSGNYAEEWGEGWNTLNPAPNRYVAPWARSGTPGYADGGNKFDLSRWDEKYFTRLKGFLAEAGKRGIVVELSLFCVFYEDKQWELSPMNARNNVNDIGKSGRLHVFDESDPAMMKMQEELVRKIVGEVREFDNVYFEVCNEPYFAEGPAMGKPWNDRIIRAIRQVDEQHLIALNVANGSSKVEKMHEGISIFNFHYCRPPDAVGMNYRHGKVIAFDETGFQGPKRDAYRREAWDFLMAGGAVYSNLDWSFTAESEAGRGKGAEERLGPNDPELRPQLAHLKRFIESFDFVKMKPENGIIKGGVPKGATCRALAEPGRQYAVYVNGGSDAALQIDLPAGEYSVDWVNTKTGKTDKHEQVKHAGGTATLRSPQYELDVALAIRRR